MDTPNPTTQIVNGAKNALSINKIVFAIVITIVVMFAISYFVRQELVETDEAGNKVVKGTLKPRFVNPFGKKA